MDTYVITAYLILPHQIPQGRVVVIDYIIIIVKGLLHYHCFFIFPEMSTT